MYTAKQVKSYILEKGYNYGTDMQYHAHFKDGTSVWMESTDIADAMLYNIYRMLYSPDFINLRYSTSEGYGVITPAGNKMFNIKEEG